MPTKNSLSARRIAHQVRSLIPARALPWLVRRRVDRLWADPTYRDAQEAEMRELLEFTHRAAEIPVLARAFAEAMTLRAYQRWRPAKILHQEVRGIEILTSQRDPGRSVVLSFWHHANYEGIFSSLDSAGAHCHVMIMPAVLEPDVDPGMRQHITLMSTGATVVPASGGTDALAALLRPGMTMAIASDVPGRTPVTFLGRRVLGSFGAARIATMTDSPVVVVTSHRGDHGPYLQLHPPLEPTDFDDPADLLAAMLAIHGAAILDWPEVVDQPRSRFGALSP